MMNARALLVVRLSYTIAAIALLSPRSCQADNYTYKPGEFVKIQNGLSPNHHFSIATHGEGADGSDHFHAYLMSEPDHKRIGPLTEIGDDVIDTAPGDFNALWSADSRHVAILYWADRHFLIMQLYRIENRRAYPVKGPSLLEAADVTAQRKREDPSYWRAGNIEFHWLTPTRFSLLEHDELHLVTIKLVQALGKFAKSEKDDPPADGYPTTYSVLFSAEAVCDLTPDDRYRVVRIKPGRFDN